MKKMYLMFLSIVVLGVLAKAQTTYIWKNTGLSSDSAWNTASNWTVTGGGTASVPPTPSDSVVFNNTTVQRVYFTANAAAKNINFAGSANVVFGIKGGAVSTVYTVNVGGTTSANYTTKALQFSGTLNSLGLNAMRTSGTGCGIILNVLTGNSATIPSGKTIHLASSGTPSQDSVSSSQVNQLTAADANGITFSSGSTCNINVRNNALSPNYPFGTYGLVANTVVFASGSILNNNSASHAIPWGSTSGVGTCQFQQGSRFNLQGGATTFNATYILGRTYGTLNISSVTNTTNAVFANTTSITTTFLDSFIVNTGTAFNITLTGATSAVGAASPTYSFNNIKVSSTLATPNTNIFFRAQTVASSPNTTIYISGDVNIASTVSNTTGPGAINIYFGPNSTSGSTASTDIYFTGTTNLTLTKVAPTVVNAGIVIGTPSGGATMPTTFTINSGAKLNLGDSLTLRTGNSYTKFTIKPTGRLNLIDAARFITSHNSNFLVESDTTGTGSIGSISSTGSLFQNSVTIQRFIGRNAAWRTIGIPLSTAAPTKLYGGNGTSTFSQIFMNSFTTSPAQAYYFNDTLDNGQYGAGSGGANAGWRPFTTNNDSISPNKGLLLYGSRNSASPIVLSLTGFINTADQSIPLSKTAGGNGWNLVANPFLSNISWSSIISNGGNATTLASNTVYRVRPLGGGAYSWASYNANTSTGSNGGSDVIENGAAFFVQASGIARDSLLIKETDKTTNAVGNTSGGVSLLGGNDNYNTIRLNLTGANTFSDEVVFVWGRFTKATDAFDTDFDAYDLGASGTHDLSIVGNDDTKYAIFNGTDLPKTAETRIYKLGVKSLRTGTYTFTASMPKDLDRNNEAYLVDKFLNKATLVKEGMQVSFDVTADAASKAEDRFQLEVRKKLVSVADQIASSKTYLLSNPISNNQFAIHFGSDAEVANWQVVDLSGRVISTGVFKNVYQGDTRVAELKALQSGTYLVRLFNDNEQTAVMKLVKL